MKCLYVDPSLCRGGVLQDPRLPQFTERHHFRLPPVQLANIGAIERRIDNGETLGIIFGLASGLANRRVLALARYALRREKSVFLYWPTEDAIEVLDRERISSLHRHRLAYIIGTRLLAWRQRRAQKTLAAGTPVGLATAINLAPAQMVADFATTKAHLLGGIEELRRLASRIASHQDALKRLAWDAAAMGPPHPPLHTRRRSRSWRVMRQQ